MRVRNDAEVVVAHLAINHHEERVVRGPLVFQATSSA